MISLIEVISLEASFGENFLKWFLQLLALQNKMILTFDLHRLLY